MEVTNPEFLPDASLGETDMKELQRAIAENATFEDSLGFDLSGTYSIAGVDQAFVGDEAVSAVVVVENGEVVEETNAVTRLRTPYIPGLLAFREGEAVVEALETLSADPDALMLDGSGRIHYRQAGLATHIGVVFDTPAVGVAKSLLCGAPVRETDALKQGERVEIVADETVEADEGTPLGYAYQSKQYSETSSTKVNPLYVSPGHRTDAETAVRLVSHSCDNYKLPEPVRLADSLAEEAKETL